MQLEGQIRIPSGCAISAIISKEGNRMTGEKIIQSMIPMHDRSNGLGGGFAAYGIYPEYRDFYAFHIFFQDDSCRVECEKFLKDSFEIVKAETIPYRKIPEITDIPLIWRYYVAPLSSILSRLQLDEKEYVARCVMQINTRISGAYVFSSGKNMGVSIVWTNMRPMHGPHTAATRRTPRAGGAEHIRLHFLTIPSYITARFPLMMQIVVLSRCSVTNVHFRPIPRLSPTLQIICSAVRALPWKKRRLSSLLLSGATLNKRTRKRPNSLPFSARFTPTF